MVLALLAVATATILGMALASTSSASVTTGHSLTVTAAARAAAAGGLDVATALLADPSRLGGAAPSGSTTVMFANMQIGGAVYRAEVTDLLTGAAATVDSNAVAVVVRAEVDGVTQALRAAGRLIRPDSVDRADLDLSEFAVFSTGADPIVLDGNSRIGTWSQSPYAALREPLLVGNSAGTEFVPASDHARLRGWAEVRIGTPPTTNEGEDAELAQKIRSIASSVTAPEPPDPELPKYQKTTPETLPNDSIFDNFVCTSDAILTASITLGETGRNIVIDVGGNLTVTDTIYVIGPTVLVVRGDLLLDDASQLTIKPDASLTIITYGNSALRSEVISNEEERPSGDGLDAYLPNPLRFTLYSRGPKVEIETTLFGEIYAPDSEVVISGSAVYGRVLGRTVALHDSSVFYDPALNSGIGWSNPDSALFANGSPEAPPRIESESFAQRSKNRATALEVPKVIRLAALNKNGAGNSGHGDHLADLDSERATVRARSLNGHYAGRVVTDPMRIGHRFRAREPVLAP